MSRPIPGYQNGIARGPSQAVFPGLWEGLTAAWSPGIGGRNLVVLPNAAPVRNNLVGTSMTSSAFSGSPRGQAFIYDGSTNYWISDVLPWVSGPISIAIWQNVPLPGSTRIAFGCSRSGNGAVRCSAHLPYSDGNGYWDFGDILGSGRVSWAYGGIDKWTMVVLTAGGTVAGGMAAWENGNLMVSSGSADEPSNLLPFRVGGCNLDSNIYYHEGQMGDFLVWSRVLSPQEIQLLAAGASPLHRVPRYRWQAKSPIPPESPAALSGRWVVTTA